MYEAIVIGVSAGGMEALRRVFKGLSKDFRIPVIIVQHLARESNNYHIQYLSKLSSLRIKEAEDKEEIQPGTVYFSPANYHLLVEDDFTLALSTDSKVNYSRPAIDVLFESAAEVYGSGLIGIILTGANSDGTAGMIKIKENGGLLIVQEPKTAEVGVMPLSVINQIDVDHIFNLNDIASFLEKLSEEVLQNG